MASIRYVRIGTTVKGSAAELRPEAAAAWTLLVAVVKAEMGIDLAARIIQARGGAAASAETHSDGAAVDVRVWGLTKTQRTRIVLLARECGFPASWDRPWEGNEHLHLGADVHSAWTHVDYQVIAVKDGYNGLGKGGRGGKDDGPKPSAWRNTATGVAWARQKLTTPSKPNPAPQEDIMATKEELAVIVQQQVNAALISYSEKQNRFLDRTADGSPARATSHFVVQGHAAAVAAARNSAAVLGRLAALEAALAAVNSGREIDKATLAEITEAAESGVRRGLEGASVTVELGG